MYIYCIQNRMVGIKILDFSRYKALINILLASQTMRCRASISNKKSSGWESDVEEGNVSQLPKKNSKPKKNGVVRGIYLLLCCKKAKNNVC